MNANAYSASQEDIIKKWAADRDAEIVATVTESESATLEILRTILGHLRHSRTVVVATTGCLTNDQIILQRMLDACKQVSVTLIAADTGRTPSIPERTN